MVAEHCRRRGDLRGAIEFLLVCGNFADAFHLASTHDEMGAFESAIGASSGGGTAASSSSSTSAPFGNNADGSGAGGAGRAGDSEINNTSGGPTAGATSSSGTATSATTNNPGHQQMVEEYFAKIAGYYEEKHMLSKAAEHYARCGRHRTALRLYLRQGQDADINAAIAVVGRARQDDLTHELIDYLNGAESMDRMVKGLSANGEATVSGDAALAARQPRDPQYIYRLHKALGNHEQAAGSALVIAKQEQDQGNYKVVHELLFKTWQDLAQQDLPVPLDLHRKLLLLHSYVIVKRLVKGGDHTGAARMLLRVAEQIAGFPAHIVL